MEKPSACASRLILSIAIFVICFPLPHIHARPQNVSVAVEFEITPLDVLTFEIDGTDPMWGRSTNEICALGNVDSRGTPISGAPVGNPDVNGVIGIPVDSTGAPLAGFDDAGCIGAFYPLFAATGGNTIIEHPNCALLMRLQSNSAWLLTCHAQLVASTTQVNVSQLKWKMDATASNGFQSYTGFTTAAATIASGSGSVNTRYYMDYGLLVEFADEPGANSWLVTYTLTAN